MDLNSLNIEIFVSCPTDVIAEKRIVKEVCIRVNNNLLHMGCNIQLTFRDCSEIIGRAGIRPQQLINETIRDFNIYFGILYMRFGTPSGAVNKLTDEEFESGTEEEFVLACENKRLGKNPTETYFFFKDQIGSKNTNENTQAGKVLRFKEKLMDSDWVNSFKTIEQFERDIFDLLTRITGKICLASRIELKTSNIDKIINRTKIDVFSFVPEFPKLPDYIPRSISLFEAIEDNKPVFFIEDRCKILIHDILINEKRIVLLGNAGSGKSIELQQIAKYYLHPDTQFIPVYKRFNTYANEDIEDFLPIGWEELNSEITLILFDGLDEIQPQYFNTAVSKIIDFTQRYVNIRIMITCRTNFYELPTETFSGTLTGFRTYLLNDISLAEIKNYATSSSGIDGEKLIQDAYEGSVLDLISKPFFLNILIKHYKEKGNFTDGLANIIEAAIFSKIDSDKEHFKTTISTQKSKLSILSLLEKVAFVMEVMGKNFISDNELEKVLVNSKDLKQIKYFSAFTKNVQNGQWMFEHNNIQEFLASRVLGRQPFQTLIQTLSFPTAYNKIKPTWINTLSFLISTANEILVKEIVEWVDDKESEIIVKFEPDRIEKDFRIKLFKKIFNFYKEKNIWLNSNKFNDNEFARFGAEPEVLNFLINEISDEANTRIVRLNAITTIQNFILENFDPSIKTRIKEALIVILEDNHLDGSMIHSILCAIAKMHMTDKETLEYLIFKYQKRKNQYIRAGLYKLINKAGKQSDYVDLFLDGLSLINSTNSEGDRENTNLADESWELEEGIEKIRHPKAIKKILNYLKDPLEKEIYIRNESEIITKVIENAVHAYSNDHSIYNYIFEIFINAAKNYDQYYATILIPFFEKVQKKWETFQNIWFDKSVSEGYKDFILSMLVDKSIANKFLNGYFKRDFNNLDAKKMHKMLSWKFSSLDKDFYIIKEFENKIAESSGLKIETIERVDWEAIRKKKTQESFDLLFDKEDLLKEIERIFTKIGLEELKQEDLREVTVDSYQQTSGYFAHSALETIRDCIRNGGKIYYEELKKWILEGNNFNTYLIEEIYQHLYNHKDLIEISDKQLNFISEWCQKIANLLNIEKGIKVRPGNKIQVSVDKRIIKLWYFIHRFNILIPEKKLLGFSLFHDHSNQSNLKESGIINELEAYVSKDKIIKRIIENIFTGIDVDYVWKDNAAYAILNNLKSAFPRIIKDLADINKSEHYRNEILQLYFKKTRDFDSLVKLLKEILKDELRWKIVELFIEHEAQHSFLIDYLQKVLINDNELISDQIIASKYLMNLNQIDGFAFIVKYVLEKRDPQIDYRNCFSSLSHIKVPEAIPLLLDLLKLAKHSDFQLDHFNNLESIILESLYNIGVYSEANFILIKEAFEKFTLDNKDNISDLNFLYFAVKRIEEQLYLKISQSYSIDEAITEFENLEIK